MSQRVVVALSCVAFWVLASTQLELNRTVKHVLFAATCALAGVEKLASMMNTIAVERDWVSWRTFNLT